MIEKLAENITDWQIRKGSLHENEREVYQYGYTLLIEVITNIFITIFCGAVFHKLAEMMLYLAFFIPLRSYAGGFHMKKAWQCTIATNVMILAAGSVAGVLAEIVLDEILLWIEGLSGIVIIYLAPVDTSRKPLNDVEKKKFGKKARSIYILEVFLSVLLLVCGLKKAACIGILSHAVLAAMLGIMWKYRMEDLA